MKFIDYIFKNLDENLLIKQLRRKSEDSSHNLVELILNCVWDVNSLKNRILPEYIDQGVYYSINDIFHEKKFRDQFGIYNKYIIKFKKNLSENNILNFFKETEIRNTWSGYKYDLNNPLSALNEDQKLHFNILLQQYLIETVFFQKLKSFKVIGFFGPKNPSDIGKDFCIVGVYCKPEKISLIFEFYCNDFPNEDYKCHFKKGEINKKDILNFTGKYTDRSYYTEYRVSKNIDAYFTKGDFKKPYNTEITTKYKQVKIKTFSKESYLKKFKKDTLVTKQFLTSNPEMYLKSSPSTLKDINLLSKIICDDWDKNPKTPLMKNKLFHYLMTEKKGFSDNKDFINQIMYHCNDIEKFKGYLDNRILNDKSIMDELNILGLFRSRTKNFVKKVLSKNKDKLNDLAGNYIPKHLLNDPDIMMSIIKLDLDCMMHIGDKLKKNDSFMRKVNKLVKS